MAVDNRVFDFTGGAETISLTDTGGADGMSTIDSDLAESVTFANPMVSLTINAGIGSDIVNLTEVDAAFNAALTVNGGTGDDTVNLNADITFASDKNLDIDLQDDDATPGTDVINVGTGANLILSGTGAATLKASRNIVLNSSSLTTVNGGITLHANQQASATAGNFIGLDANSATIQTTGTGNIELKGLGGADAGTGAHYGVSLHNGTSVSSTATVSSAGTITITGTGGNGAGPSYGVILFDSTTDVTSVAGAIAITGVGGNGTSDSNFGVLASDIETIQSTGTGSSAATITLNGTGGNGTSFNYGVDLIGATTDVTSVDGAISITGTGGNGSGNANRGVNIEADAAVQVTTATLTVTGTAVAGNSQGVRLAESSGGRLVSIGSGNIVVTADGNGTSSDLVAGSDSIIGDATHVGAASAATGNMTLNADSIDFSGTLSVESDGALVIQPRTANTTIGLGGGSGTLNLSDTELGFLQDGFSSIKIGDATNGTGAVDVDSSTFTDPLTIVGGSIAVTELSAGSNSVTLTARSTNISDGGDSGTDVTGSSLVVTSISGVGASGDVLSTAVSNLEAVGGTGGVFVSNTGDLTIGGIGATVGVSAANADIRITAASNLTISEAINSGGGSVTLTATGNIAVQASITSGGGRITLNADSDQSTTPGGNIDVRAAITSSGGNITLGGGADPSSTPALGQTDATTGIFLSAATLDSSGGNISLRGTGLDDESGPGIALDSGVVGANVITSGAGSITLVGNSRTNSFGFAQGVRIVGSTAQSISTTSGSIAITGTSLGVSSDAGNTGVMLQQAVTITSQTGSITITGIGAEDATSDDNDGVVLGNGATVQSTGSATISITGTAGSGSASEGVSTSGSSVTIGGASATGAISIVTDMFSTNSASHTIASSGPLTIRPLSAGTTIGVGGLSGTLTLTDTFLSMLADGFSSITIGDAANGTGPVDVDSSTFTDPVMIVGGSIAVTELNADANAIALTARTGAITDGGDLGTDLVGSAVSLQTTGGAGGTIGASGDAISLDAVSLTTNSSASSGDQFLSEVDTVTIAGTDLNAGMATITLAGGTFLTAAGGGDILSDTVVAAGATLGGTGSVTGSVQVLGGAPGGTVAPGISPGCLATGDLALASGSTFAVELDGTTACTDYDQLQVTGAGSTISLDNATLQVTLGFVPQGGAMFTIINSVDAATTVVGTFAGIPEGGSLVVGNAVFRVTYRGGTGNDVVLTAVPRIFVDDIAVLEGRTPFNATALAQASLTVRLSAPTTQVVSVDFATADGSGIAGAIAPDDYTAASGTVTFAPGQTQRSIVVLIQGDARVELDETFLVNLAGAMNAVIGDAEATATILNDDVGIRIRDVSITEGNAGSSNAVVTVSLTGSQPHGDVTVAFTTADGTATAGSDYTATSGTITFTPGVRTRTIAVPVLGDLGNEPNETFFVNLTSSANAVIADNQSRVTIRNDDRTPIAAITPTLSVGPLVIVEPDSGSTTARSPCRRPRRAARS
jgi:hypothetical protein